MEKFDHLFIQPRDWGKSFDFFKNSLGWKVVHQFGSASDAGRLAELSYGEFKLILAEDHDVTDPSLKPATYATKGKVSIHFSTQNVDATYETIKDKSNVITPPENTHWGTRWFVMEDPDGNQFGWQGPTTKNK